MAEMKNQRYFSLLRNIDHRNADACLSSLSFKARIDIAAPRPGSDERGLIQRPADRTAIGTSESGLTEALLSPALSGAFEMVKSAFAPHSSSGPWRNAGDMPAVVIWVVLPPIY
ncbi:hypothetical protein LCM17_10655 [Cereibacter sphaeroides]|nr:hypothetical protein [Cereibacter sphaeroides]